MFPLIVQTFWYANIDNYLVLRKTPPRLSTREKHHLVESSFPFSWISGYLFYIQLDNVMRRCVREDEVYDILLACHDETCGINSIAMRIVF